VVLPPATAAEAVIAAARPEAEIPRGHSRTAWARRVRCARDEGVSFDLEMTEAPVACLAAPVHAPGGAVVAAVGVAVLDPRGLPRLVDAVRDTAGRISANLARIPGAGRTLHPLGGAGDR
jgi:DNA-binding IclR family transcriptional regulator